MLAVSLIAIPIAAYIWLLLRAADDERTGWDNHPVFPDAAAHRPYSWGDDESVYRWLIKDPEWGQTLADIDALPTTQEPVG